MVAKINACLLSVVIIVDIEDLGIAPSNTLERLVANPAHKSRPGRRCTLDDKRILLEAIKVGIVECGGSTGLLEIVALWILEVKVANIN